MAVMDALMELAVDIEIDQAALEKVNATMALIGMPLDEISDKVAYIKHCCITDGRSWARWATCYAGNWRRRLSRQPPPFQVTT